MMILLQSWLCFTTCIAVIIDLIIIPTTCGMQCSATPSNRFDCYPGQGANQQSCQQRGCCWIPAKNKKHIVAQSEPYCFYPKDYPTYKMGTPIQTTFGLSVTLSRSTTTYYPGDVMILQMDVYFETASRLHFKIYDPKFKRYEVPIPTQNVTKKAIATNYKVQLSQSPMGIVVARSDDGTVIFNSSVNTLIFTDQFIQISTSLVTPYIYGLGEHRGSFKVPSNWRTYSMWARDQPPMLGANLYGEHPFYLNLEGSSGKSHGVFLLNSNAMEVVLQPAPALTFRTIGGILDFYIFLGHGPDDVIQQYTEVIGRPFMPPYWGLGFHLCRWGYGSSNRTLQIVKRMKAEGIPQDTQWNDIDYMQGHKDFTFSSSSYQGLPALVQYLHSNDQHYIMILDPAISSSQPSGSYAPYDTGIQQGVFIKNNNGKTLIGQVWPGATAFPDFFNIKTKSWWYNQLKGFHDQVNFDGIWLDMNEPSNFVTGSVDGCPTTTYDNPPYTPGILGGNLALKTVCASAIQSIGRHYDLHNLYGYSETVATNKALVTLRQKRSFIIARSTYPGSGKYGGHWLGDNYSIWPDMLYSIAGILSFNLFGIPLVGADICGFNFDTTEELCQRWMQLGAFYPFSRNHNTLNGKDQDPTSFSQDMQISSKQALQLRYALLPYMYTLFHLAHVNGSTVARPLFFEFPFDAKLYDVDRQFMLGAGLVITPVLDEGARKVTGTFPKGRWYSVVHGNHFRVNSTLNVELDAPLNEINVHQREGHIIPTQPNYNETTTAGFRKTPFTLSVARSDDGHCIGKLYWDDGDSLDSYETGNYLSVVFSSSDTLLNSTVMYNGYSGSNELTVGSIVLMGVPGTVTYVKVNGTDVDFLYDNKLQNIFIQNIHVPVQYNFYVQWQWA